METKKDIAKEIDYVLEDTTKFDFPFLANQDKKKAIVAEKKIYVEEKLKKIIPESFPNTDALKKMWDESVKYTDEQFKTLPEKHRLNGFYLQEVIHCYAEKIGNTILDNI